VIFASIAKGCELTWLVKSEKVTPFDAWYYECQEADPSLARQNDTDLIDQARDIIYVFQGGREITKEVYDFLKSLGIRRLS
jgi:hypothetical protein